MNRTLRIMRSAALVALVGAIATGGAFARPMQAKESDTKQESLSRMANVIEIMRILVAKSINEGAFSERYADAMKTAREQAKKELAKQLDDNGDAAFEADARLLRTYNALAGNSFSYVSGEGTPTFTSHTRGFYAEGVGVLFTTEVSTPGRLVEREEPKEPAKSKASEDDEWQRAAMEAAGRSNVFFGDAVRARSSSRAKRVWEIDPAYVDDAVNGVLETVAKYGMRITDLPDDESIIVAMRFEGDRGGIGFGLPYVSTVSGDAFQKAQMEAELAAAAEDRAAKVEAEAPPSPESAPAPSVYTVWSSDWNSTWRQRQLHVVIQVPKSAIKQYSGGNMSMDALRQSATITRYGGGGEDDEMLAPMAR